MKDFKNYTPPPDGGGQKKTNDLNSTVQLAQTLSKAMNGKSEGQLLHTIIAEAEKSKMNGSLSNADLDNFYNSLAPMLDGFKRKKLKEVITRLKNI